MTDKVRGRVLIINNINFTDPRLKRLGAEVDYVNISTMFRDLKFDIAKGEQPLTDLTAQVIL